LDPFYRFLVFIAFWFSLVFS